ncbi:MAG: hypothetical protein WAS07_10405, partial [Micropruina sp.]
ALRADIAELNAELIQYIDISIALERDRDQCARERDVYKAERDALAARVAALEEALRPAWEADEGATGGVWGVEIEGHRRFIRIAKVYFNADVPEDGSANARLIATAVNAVRAAREVSNA